MEALFSAATALMQGITAECLKTSVYEEEAAKLARYVSKIALLLSELEVQLRVDEELRGSRSLFVALDNTVAALQQARQLVQQCSKTPPGSVWPLEDAVEFQAVAAELLSSVAGLHRLDIPLPPDVRADVEHFYSQFKELQFTPGELSETEDAEMARVQAEGSLHSTPRAAAARAAAAAEAAAAAAGQAGAEAGGEEEGEPATPTSEHGGAGTKAPLPDDPFSMAKAGRVASSTLVELRGLKLEGEPGEAAEDPLLTALEAHADAEPLLGAAQRQPSDQEAVRNLQELAGLGD